MVGKRTLSGTDEMRLQELGVQKECVKCVPFTFSFKPQQDHYTRADLTLPEEKFLVATVGWRLDDEITGAYLKMLEEAVGEEPAIHVVFVGRFHRFGEALAGYPVLQAHATNLGEQQDVLAVLECMDLYVNPARSGGGSSAAEALSKGLPVVTLPVGDVAVAAGETFEVEDYPAMQRQILRYAADKAEITGIQAEPWHYRYVGEPHATYMKENNLCLEEYLTQLKDYTSDNRLQIVNWDGEIYEVYYVAADMAADSTYVLVPPDQDYTISGNNSDGFIITVDTGRIQSFEENSTAETTAPEGQTVPEETQAETAAAPEENSEEAVG